MKTKSPTCCIKLLKLEKKWFSAYNENGERFYCHTCKRGWIYVEDEAEGGAWWPDKLAPIKAKRSKKTAYIPCCIVIA